MFVWKRPKINEKEAGDKSREWDKNGEKFWQQKIFLGKIWRAEDVTNFEGFLNGTTVVYQIKKGRKWENVRF